MTILRAISYCALTYACCDVYLSLGPRREQRKRLYRRAKARAKELGKPLVVIGSPTAGVVNRYVGLDYGCGDLCIDLQGCATCKNQVAKSVEEVLPRLKDESCVVFVSCVLEYVDDVRPVWRELRRVSGGELFIACVEPWSMTALVYPGAKRQIYEAPPASKKLVWRELHT